MLTLPRSASPSSRRSATPSCAKRTLRSTVRHLYRSLRPSADPARSQCSRKDWQVNPSVLLGPCFALTLPRRYGEGPRARATSRARVAGDAQGEREGVSEAQGQLSACCLSPSADSRDFRQSQYDKTKQRSLLNPQSAPLAGDQSFANALASPALSSRQVPGTPRQTFVPAHASNNAGFGIQRSSSRASVSSRVGGTRPAGGQAAWSGSSGQQGRMSTSFGGGGGQQHEASRRPLGEQRTNVQSRGSGGSGGSGFAKAPHHAHEGEGGMQFLGQQQQQSGGMGGARSGGGFTGFNRSASGSPPGTFARLY